MLIIEGRKESRPNPTYVKDSKNWRTSRKTIEYTSSCFTTQGKHSWKFGHFEIKARIKSAPGLWPAIWTLGIEGKWPSNGKVDILECYKDQILANACWGTGKAFTAKWDSNKKPLASFNDPQWQEKFHVWRMDWDEKEIKLHVDGILLNTIDLTKTLNPNSDGPKNLSTSRTTCCSTSPSADRPQAIPRTRAFRPATKSTTSGSIRKRGDTDEPLPMAAPRHILTTTQRIPRSICPAGFWIRDFSDHLPHRLCPSF